MKWNLTYPWFGSYCEYTFDISFNSIVRLMRVRIVFNWKWINFNVIMECVYLRLFLPIVHFNLTVPIIMVLKMYILQFTIIMINAFKIQLFDAKNYLLLRYIHTSDGQACSLYSKSCCKNGRDKFLNEILQSYNENKHLSYQCWLVLYCAINGLNNAITNCSSFCISKNNICIFDIQNRCPSSYVIY